MEFSLSSRTWPVVCLEATLAIWLDFAVGQNMIAPSEKTKAIDSMPVFLDFRYTSLTSCGEEIDSVAKRCPWMVWLGRWAGAINKQLPCRNEHFALKRWSYIQISSNTANRLSKLLLRKAVAIDSNLDWRCFEEKRCSSNSGIVYVFQQIICENQSSRVDF